MKKQWDIEELEATFTLLPAEIEWLIEQSEPYNKLGQAIQLKFFQQEGRFPEKASEVPLPVVEFIGQQLEINVALLERYDWRGRTSRNHKRDIRQLYGFRPINTEDQSNLQNWLVQEVLPDEYRPNYLANILYARMRQLQIEPPTRGRLTTLIQNALHGYEEQIYQRVANQLSDKVKTNLRNLIYKKVTPEKEEEAQLMLHDLKTGMGATKVRNIKRVAKRLAYLQQLDLPDSLFADLPNRYLNHLAQRASVESVSHLQRHANEDQTLTLLAAFCWTRQRRITDPLVALFIRVLNDIRLRAKQRVERELLQDYIRVGGKNNYCTS